MRPAIVIPAYQPDERLVTLVDALRRNTEDQAASIVIVNDGSGPACDAVFRELAAQPGIVVLTHDRNRGKGAALKTGFDWVRSQYGAECPGVVTADADGQHLPGDILAILNALQNSPDRLWLGMRKLDDDSVPLRSRIGNGLTVKIFQWFTGQAITDTQTGLRGIPGRYLEALLQIKATGYDFELEMLLRARENGLSVSSLPIRTVYEPGNTTSHFRPVRDSFRVYGRFIAFAGIGLISALLDYGLFSLCYLMSGEILLSIALARLCSGVFNFASNRHLVFQGRGPIYHEALKYTLLAMTLVGMNYLLTKGFYLAGLTPFIGKPLGEALILLISFQAQRRLVFRRREST